MQIKGFTCDEKCGFHLQNAARGRRLMAAFSNPRSQFLTTRTDPKPANNIFTFFPAVNWLSSGFVYVSLSLNWLMCRRSTESFVKNIKSEGASNSNIRQAMMY